ncbi:MarR family winged helix-turn-helix transcriptional regulator [Nocardioides litoris]|uniref:MarR family winged helix-turn-helix transcriptional regulator n=1 Tax=Nocardioides litoris TaxID=1926648 RepID=UPI001FE54D43|nr:MarR family transcriptional regulator [Nocardioides litoris]
MAADVRWLSEPDKEGWSGLLSLLLVLPARLDAPLRAATGLTLFDYVVLSGLSEAPGRRLRMSDLAFLSRGSLSRLSNVVRRLEERGLVTRSPDPDDARSTTAALTDAGLDLVREAAPTHVASVRAEVVDRLDADDLAALARIAARLGVRPTDQTQGRVR